MEKNSPKKIPKKISAFLRNFIFPENKFQKKSLWKKIPKKKFQKKEIPNKKPQTFMPKFGGLGPLVWEE
jgi:hypothetical protein